MSASRDADVGEQQPAGNRLVVGELALWQGQRHADFGVKGGLAGRAAGQFQTGGDIQRDDPLVRRGGHQAGVWSPWITLQAVAEEPVHNHIALWFARGQDLGAGSRASSTGTRSPLSG